MYQWIGRLVLISSMRNGIMGHYGLKICTEKKKEICWNLDYLMTFNNK